MTAAIPMRADGCEYDDFLYAPIGEEGDGMLLSVLSALARLNVDPWDEASRLARLPREAATRFLATLIAALPDGSSARTDPEAHARRLTALLPQGLAIDDPPSRPVVLPGFAATHRELVRYLVSYTVLTALLLGGQWLMHHSVTAAPSPVPQVAPERH